MTVCISVLPCSLAHSDLQKHVLTWINLGSNLGSTLRSTLLPSFPQLAGHISCQMRAREQEGKGNRQVRP